MCFYTADTTYKVYVSDAGLAPDLGPNVLTATTSIELGTLEMNCSGLDSGLENIGWGWQHNLGPTGPMVPTGVAASPCSFPVITQNGVAIANAQPTYASGGGNQGPLAGNDTAFFSEGQFLNDLNRFLGTGATGTVTGCTVCMPTCSFGCEGEEWNPSTYYSLGDEVVGRRLL